MNHSCADGRCVRKGRRENRCAAGQDVPVLVCRPPANPPGFRRSPDHGSRPRSPRCASCQRTHPSSRRAVPVGRSSNRSSMPSAPSACHAAGEDWGRVRAGPSNQPSRYSDSPAVRTLPRPHCAARRSVGVRSRIAGCPTPAPANARAARKHNPCRVQESTPVARRRSARYRRRRRNHLVPARWARRASWIRSRRPLRCRRRIGAVRPDSTGKCHRQTPRWGSARWGWGGTPDRSRPGVRDGPPGAAEGSYRHGPLPVRVCPVRSRFASPSGSWLRPPIRRVRLC